MAQRSLGEGPRRGTGAGMDAGEGREGRAGGAGQQRRQRLLQSVEAAPGVGTALVGRQGGVPRP